MIIEHEENPSWAVSSPPPHTAHRRIDPGAMRTAHPQRELARPFKASIASYAVFGLLIAAMLLSSLTVGG